MPLAHVVRVKCKSCPTVIIVDADVSFDGGEIVTVPKLVNAWHKRDDEFFCSESCYQDDVQKRPVHEHVYLPPITKKLSSGS